MKFTKTEFQKQFNKGSVFAYPTEAVYGLGCDPLNEAAMEKILDLKHRPVEKGVILIAGHVKQLEGFANLSILGEQATALINKSWPGPFTFLVPKGPKTPNWISGDSQLVAVRVTTHPLVKEMCDAIDSPLVSTSANIAGQPPAKTADEVTQYFSDRVTLIDGELGSQSKPSTIINAITLEKIR